MTGMASKGGPGQRWDEPGQDVGAGVGYTRWLFYSQGKWEPQPRKWGSQSLNALHHTVG